MKAGLLFVGVCLVGLFVWGLNYQPPLGVYSATRAAAARAEIAKDEAEEAARKAAEAALQPAEPAPPPGVAKAVVDQAEFDFGVMEPGQAGEHAFSIQNQGTATLTLENAGTSCKCTLLDMPDGQIEPGQERRVKLEWTTQEAAEIFRHGALVKTNDPERPVLDLVVSGKVRTILAASTDAVVFTDLGPGEGRSQSVTVYSQVWGAFEIEKVESPRTAITATARPANQAELAALGARAGWVLDVRVAAGLPKGVFAENLAVHVRLPESTSTGMIPRQSPLAVPVSGRVLGSLSFYGQLLDTDGILNVGPLTQAKGFKKKIHLAVRNARSDLEVTVRSSTDLVHVTVTRETPKLGNNNPEKGNPDDGGAVHARPRFAIEIEIPPGTPEVNHMGPDAAWLEVVTNDPSHPETRLPLEFCVVP